MSKKKAGRLLTSSFNFTPGSSSSVRLGQARLASYSIPHLLFHISCVEKNHHFISRSRIPVSDRKKKFFCFAKTNGYINFDSYSAAISNCWFHCRARDSTIVSSSTLLRYVSITSELSSFSSSGGGKLNNSGSTPRNFLLLLLSPTRHYMPLPPVSSCSSFHLVDIYPLNYHRSASCMFSL